MIYNAKNINWYIFFKLPSAYWCGVRLKAIDENSCLVSVRHKWFNQNPFKSIYFAVQSMAAELSTGALVMAEIKKRDLNASMLVANCTCNFSKKARGRINFVCSQGTTIVTAFDTAIEKGEAQTLWLKSIGINEKGEQVSAFDFEWTIKIK